MTAFEVVRGATPGGQVLRVHGELHRFTVSRFHEALRCQALEPGVRLVLDLTGVPFCDSSGVAALIAARNRVVAAAGTIALVGVPPGLEKALRVLGLAELLPAYPTAEDAARAVPPGADQEPVP